MCSNTVFLDCLEEKAHKKIPIIGSGTGCGLSAEACETGGADFVALYHTAIYRISGLPTMLSFLPYDNCNQMVFDALPSVRSRLKQIPLFAGLGAHDPRCPVEDLVERALTFGVHGIVNEPFCGAYGTMIRQALDACNMGFQAEYKMITCALSKNLLALGWSYSTEEAVAFAAAGTPLIGIIIDSNTLPDTALTMETITEYIHAVCDAVKKENPKAITLLHGKPLDNLPVIQAVLENTDANGYFTGSMGERYPIMRGIKDAIGQLKRI